VYIIKGGSPPLYLIKAQVGCTLARDEIQPYGLMIYRNELRMIYTPSARLGCEDAKTLELPCNI